MNTRVLLVSIVPPRNDCGVRIVMHRHLVERQPFDLHVASNADFADGLLIHTRLRLPWLLQRLRKSRFGPIYSKWLQDFENWFWPIWGSRDLERTIAEFKPDVILTLAETGVCHLAARAARRHGIPLAGLFLDWFPIMAPSYYGHKVFCQGLSRRYRCLYRQCDLAICTSDGMKEMLGPHANSHVVYPMPGIHAPVSTVLPPKSDRFRLVYVGSVKTFYGRMISSLLTRIRNEDTVELIVVGADADWPPAVVEDAKRNGTYLGYMPPPEAAKVLSGADALLVVMSFEREHEVFMRTSFTTKFLDYVSFGKPVVLWAPDYCTPMRVVQREGGALPVNQNDASAVVDALMRISSDHELRTNLEAEARKLHEGTFNPERLQGIFVEEMDKIAGKTGRSSA
jgi:glycosyltransferase involved in cell wall biosynthesis